MVAEGRLLNDRYRLDERIAAGAMGTVFEATDERLHRKVAIKLLKGELAEDPRFIERFRREARSAAALSHQNVAGVFDYGEDDDCKYIVMELARGSDLSRILREEGASAPERAARIAGQIAAALAHAHSLGVVHRDIKPANVLIGPDDNVKVTDFGIARATGDSTLTATGSVLGTAHYLSPEQASGLEVGPPSDVYSLGIVLYEMLTGAVPFTGDSAISVAMRHVNDEVPAPSSLQADVPPELDEVVRRATQKNPADRFPSASEMAAALLGGDIGMPTERLDVPAAVGASTLIDDGPRTAVLGATSRSVIAGVSSGRAGRTALWVLGGLALVAILLALFRGATGEDDATRRAGAGGTAANVEAEPEETDATAESTWKIPTGLYGSEAGEFIDAAEAEGLVVEPEYIPTEDLEPNLIVAVSPGEGSIVEQGGTITLQISSEPEEDEEEGEGNGPPDDKGKPDKVKEDKEDDD